MNLITIPEDRLLDVPDEELLSKALHNLHELNINLSDIAKHSEDYLDSSYNQFLEVAKVTA